MIPRWHGYVGWELHARNGDRCGHIGRAFPCESWEDGWTQALEWLRKPAPAFGSVRTFHVEIRFF